jgi:hypothetical protein
MTQQLRSVGAVSCAKVFAVLYGMLGFLIGTAVSAVFFLSALVGRQGLDGPPSSGPIAFMMGAGSIIFFPVLYAVIGAVGGLIMAALYNLVANYMGGIEVDIV